MLLKAGPDGISAEVDPEKLAPALVRPNNYQTVIQFLEQWLIQKLLYGNTYVLKQRDDRARVIALYVLASQRSPR
jgi:phage portal protein BeeE